MFSKKIFPHGIEKCKNIIQKLQFTTKQAAVLKSTTYNSTALIKSDQGPRARAKYIHNADDDN